MNVATKTIGSIALSSDCVVAVTDIVDCLPLSGGSVSGDITLSGLNAQLAVGENN